MSMKKATRPVNDYHMSLHYGVCLGTAFISGIRIKETLVWPFQVYSDEQDVLVPQGPHNIDYYLGFRSSPDVSAVEAATGYGGFEDVEDADKRLLYDVVGLNINQPDAFGGDTREGGVVGTIVGLPGRSDQVLPDLIATKIAGAPEDCPGFRGVTSIFMTGLFDDAAQTTYYDEDGGYGEASALADLLDLNQKAQLNIEGFRFGSNNPYIPPVDVYATSCPSAIDLMDGSYSGGNNGHDPEARRVLMPGTVGPDANPVAIIYACMTSNKFGSGIPSDEIDIQTFKDAATQVADEGLGVSMLWTRESGVDEFVNEVLGHIQSALFVHPRTGLWTIRLIREVGTLGAPQQVYGFIDASNARIISIKRGTWSETTNTIKVTYTDPLSETEADVVVQDASALAIAGREIRTSTNYYGFRSAEAAKAAGFRDLKLISAPLITLELNLTREFWDLIPTDVLSVTFPEENLENHPFRVSSIDYGSTKDRYIRVELTEDLTGRIVQAMDAVQGREAKPVRSAPKALDYIYATLAPAPAVLSEGIESQRVENGEVSPFLIFAASSYGRNSSIGVTTASGAADGSIKDANVASISTPLNAEARTTIQASNIAWVGQDPVLKAGDILVIAESVSGSAVYPDIMNDGNQTHEEWVYVESVDSNSGDITLRRGIYDTIPRAHGAQSLAFVVKSSLQNASSSDVFEFMDANHQLSAKADLGVMAPKSVRFNGSSSNDYVNASGGNFYFQFGGWYDANGDLRAAPSDPQSEFYQRTLPEPPAPAGVATNRIQRPLRPGNVSVEGYGSFETAYLVDNLGAPFSVSWETRNRFFEEPEPLAWDGGSVTPEDDVVIFVEVEDVSDPRFGGGNNTSGYLTKFEFSGTSGEIPQTAVSRSGKIRVGSRRILRDGSGARIAHEDSYHFVEIDYIVGEEPSDGFGNTWNEAWGQ